MKGSFLFNTLALLWSSLTLAAATGKDRSSDIFNDKLDTLKEDESYWNRLLQESLSIQSPSTSEPPSLLPPTEAPAPTPTEAPPTGEPPTLSPPAPTQAPPTREPPTPLSPTEAPPTPLSTPGPTPPSTPPPTPSPTPPVSCQLHTLSLVFSTMSFALSSNHFIVIYFSICIPFQIISHSAANPTAHTSTNSSPCTSHASACMFPSFVVISFDFIIVSRRVSHFVSSFDCFAIAYQYSYKSANSNPCSDCTRRRMSC
jgi:hypothetical protein